MGFKHHSHGPKALYFVDQKHLKPITTGLKDSELEILLQTPKQLPSQFNKTSQGFMGQS